MLSSQISGIRAVVHKRAFGLSTSRRATLRMVNLRKGVEVEGSPPVEGKLQVCRCFRVPSTLTTLKVHSKIKGRDWAFLCYCIRFNRRCGMHLEYVSHWHTLYSSDEHVYKRLQWLLFYCFHIEWRIPWNCIYKYFTSLHISEYCKPKTSIY